VTVFHQSEYCSEDSIGIGFGESIYVLTSVWDTVALSRLSMQLDIIDDYTMVTWCPFTMSEVMGIHKGLSSPEWQKFNSPTRDGWFIMTSWCHTTYWVCGIFHQSSHLSIHFCQSSIFQLEENAWEQFQQMGIFYIILSDDQPQYTQVTTTADPISQV